MVSMADSNRFSVAVAVTVQAWPTCTLPMSYSSTRTETFMCLKSAICTSSWPTVTSSPFSTFSLFTRPSKPAVTVSPLDSRSSLSSSLTSSPAAM